MTADLTVDANATLDTTAANNYGITVNGNLVQSATTSQVEANSSTITVSGDLTVDGTVDSTNYNNSDLVFAGSDSSITYNNLSQHWNNGFNNLTVGQAGATDTLDQYLSVLNVLTVGSGTITGAGNIYIKGAGDVLSLDAASNISIARLSFFGATQNLPTIANGYDCNISIAQNGTTVTQTGHVTINAGKFLWINGDSFANRAVTYNTAGYDLTVGKDIRVGYGNVVAVVARVAGSRDSSSIARADGFSGSFDHLAGVFCKGFATL